MNSYQVNDWIETQLKHRLPADHQRSGHFIIDDAALMAMNAIKDISIFDAGRKEFLSVNNYDRMLDLSAERDRFTVANPKYRPAIGRRTAEFANLLMAMNMSGIYISNWCDAQGWDYEKRIPEMNGVPIIQYCRRMEQRDQICLMPLSYDYMGPGGSNMPTAPDLIPFGEKQQKLTWRGRFSGTSSDWISAMWWAQSMLLDVRDLTEEDVFKIQSCHRKKVVEELKSSPWADVKLIVTPQEMGNISRNHMLGSIFSGCIAARIAMSEQRKSKFLLVVDGNDIGTNKYWSLLSNSVVLMVKSSWETALDAGLVAGKHFIAVDPSRESIENAVSDLSRDEARCLEIINNAHELLRPNLNTRMREAVDYLTLKKYSEKIILPFGTGGKGSFARPK